MKTCFKCHTEKPLSEYYKLASMADGHLNKCKECAKRDASEHRSNNLERLRDYDRRRFQEQPKRREATFLNAKAFRLKNPEKYHAHSVVNYAIKAGKLTKPNCCQSCGIDKRLHGHHDDYTKPLEVLWLCVPCHAARHKALRQAA